MWVLWNPHPIVSGVEHSWEPSEGLGRVERPLETFLRKGGVSSKWDREWVVVGLKKCWGRLTQRCALIPIGLWDAHRVSSTPSGVWGPIWTIKRKARVNRLVRTLLGDIFLAELQHCL